MKTRDIDIRASLHSVLREEHKNEPDTLILDELGLCQGDARIDVAVVNGAINGYEIKSESDTLGRLPRQTDAYNRVFDTVTILTASRFIEGIEDIIPEWWGITKAEMDADGIVHFFPYRMPHQNPSIDPTALAQLLWREEALSVLKERGLQKGLLSKPRQLLWNALAEQLELRDLQDEVRKRLKARSRWRVH
ncbi:sce7726 family protein [Paenibacillus albidus]|uniref:sce7726 family protein n=1 Tax=Paenibacillus albidus TaxID=2041023 RepID=UPI001BE9FFC0|nr:sce7726 family protein [Paenibacillus albidus]MBT2289492.1 sce7726 family protein [Paenibacillus albidus]